MAEKNWHIKITWKKQLEKTRRHRPCKVVKRNACLLFSQKAFPSRHISILQTAVLLLVVIPSDYTRTFTDVCLTLKKIIILIILKKIIIYWYTQYVYIVYIHSFLFMYECNQAFVEFTNCTNALVRDPASALLPSYDKLWREQGIVCSCTPRKETILLSLIPWMAVFFRFLSFNSSERVHGIDFLISLSLSLSALCIVYIIHM